ncbi:endonuclease/exonuclease/phosphatase family protein [Luteipulveratus mongoliensis]|uniref:Endonuclease/exonuclease/phosphatase domain-containing protein n=1 Tax=Luteipulveratus mongoliensis TaxID=571913 RepID=A0A0K1JN66_9MICO|nr:endonuclease/exonuclease/phosphatase family protein [Luteipulveratus mongoliensis]AKU18162.1 hypothetical protein VV02_23765 [Luteipulveratus mongoliensis]
MKVFSRGRDLAVTALAVSLVGVLLGHRLIPDVGGFGTALDSVLPWLVVPVALLLVCAVGLRSRAGLVAALVPAVVCAAMFGPEFRRTASAVDGGGSLRVLSVNIGAGNQEVDRAAHQLARSEADIVVVQEVTQRTRSVLRRALGQDHPYSRSVGTVAVWSRYPMTDCQPLDLAQGWPRALRARVSTPRGEIALYAVHLASIRLGRTAGRDGALRALAQHIDGDRSGRVLVLGDLNTASTDRRFSLLTRSLHEARDGFGFTWPAGFPLTRPDHILSRGLTPVGVDVVEIAGSDHRAPTTTFQIPRR